MISNLIEILKSFLIIFIVCLPVVFLTTKLRIPSVVGFLLAGVLIGPSGVGLLKDVHLIETLAEIGVVFLMFTIGIEFSIKKLIAYRKEVLLKGFFQVLFTVIITLGLSILFLKESLQKGIFYGTLVAMSSTALVLKLLMDRGELNTTYGRSSFGILIFQDITVVFIMLILPILAGLEGKLETILFSIIKSLSIVILLFLGSYYLVPFLFHQIAKTKIRELFLMSILSLALGTALFSHTLGLSLALGAFLAGMVISESEYAYQSIAEIKPFKDLLMAIFFISVGLLLKPQYFLDNFWLTFLVLAWLLFIKFSGILTASYLIDQNLRISLLTTFYLLQIGEFSFVLALEGRKLGLINDDFYQIFIGSSVISLFITPLWIEGSHKMADLLLSFFSPKLYQRYKKLGKEKKETHLKNHTIVIGYGVAGKNIVYGLKTLNIPYVILELNPITVKKYKSRGEPIYFGDATNLEILIKIGIKTAKILVISMGDHIATRKIVSIARRENPALYIIARSKFVAEIEELLKLGANEVIPEEFEVSIEIFAKVLEKYEVPKNVIYELLEKVRSKHYKAFRTIEDLKLDSLEGLEFLKEIHTQTFLISHKTSLIDKSIKEIALRSQTGATIIAIKRSSEFIVNPSPEEVLKEGDMLFLIGKEEDLNKAIAYLSSF
ncbi:MAG: cation:proton antiporter [Thermodesulfobacteriaceae bacterium]|nr:cation:proton antiporter [Thermodesulfobacteriaceae bacterium]